jgi:ketosteroid isomerase-like protein
VTRPADDPGPRGRAGAARTPKELVVELVDAYNAKSVSRVAALYELDAEFWDPFHRDGVRGRAAIAEVVAGLFAALPDERMEIATLAGDERYAVAEFRSTGTLPATGVPFAFEFTEVYDVRDGLIASCRVYLDPEQLPG